MGTAIQKEQKQMNITLVLMEMVMGMNGIMLQK